MADEIYFTMADIVGYICIDYPKQHKLAEQLGIKVIKENRGVGRPVVGFTKKDGFAIMAAAGWHVRRVGGRKCIVKDKGFKVLK